VVDPSRLPDTSGQPLEQSAETWLDSRRGLSPEATLGDYEQVSSIGLQALTEIATLDMPVPLADAGTYPAAVLPAAYAFDHYTHIRADLFAPRGPLNGEPPSDELRAGSALDWIEAALQQQNAQAAAQATLEIQVAGAGGRPITFGSGPLKASVSSDAPAFVRWVTQRGSWADLGVRAYGDREALAVARALKVV
jgi:hypothetical protein